LLFQLLFDCNRIRIQTAFESSTPVDSTRGIKDIVDAYYGGIRDTDNNGKLIIYLADLLDEYDLGRNDTKDTFYDDDLFINLYEGKDIKTQKEAAEVIAKKIGIPQIEEDSSERVLEMLDRYFLPNIGTKKEDRTSKAHNLCKYIKRFMAISKGEASVSNKDHYANKRLKLSGDLLADLFRVNLRALVQDIVYNFQRLVKRGKFQSMKIIIRDQLLTNRIKSAMATGSWVGGRKGISQNIDRTNFIATVSHLQKVVSLLSSSQENFEARTLNPTHWGRLCPVETPEGTPIGLRKNLSITSEISVECSQLDKLKKTLAGYGLEDG